MFRRSWASGVFANAMGDFVPKRSLVARSAEGFVPKHPDEGCTRHPRCLECPDVECVFVLCPDLDIDVAI